MGKDNKMLAGIVPIEIWRKMLRVGNSLDIDKGGMYDSRSGAINVWASPEDKPAGWEHVTIDKGALDYPRSIVGTISWEPTAQLVDEKWEDAAKIFFDICPYERWRVEKREICAEKTILESEVEWMTEKALFLLLVASKELDPPGGIFCRFCDAYVKVTLFNEFIDHLVEIHNVDVKSVILGDRFIIETGTGTIEV